MYLAFGCCSNGSTPLTKWYKRPVKKDTAKATLSNARQLSSRTIQVLHDTLRELFIHINKIMVSFHTTRRVFIYFVESVSLSVVKSSFWTTRFIALSTLSSVPVPSVKPNRTCFVTLWFTTQLWVGLWQYTNLTIRYTSWYSANHTLWYDSIQFNTLTSFSERF